MSKQLGKRLNRLLLRFKQPSWQARVWITASSVAGCVLLLRAMGLLQSLEWAALDQFFRSRPPEPPDDRIVIVAIDEPDLQKVGKSPLPDNVIAEVLQKINAQKPRAIGLDIYRDIPVEPGNGELLKVYRSIPNLVGIEKLPDSDSTGVAAPPELNKLNQVGFNNVVLDADGRVRRGFLYWIENDHKPEEEITYTSFALKLALIYLEPKGITPQQSANDPFDLQLGKGVLHQFTPNDGAYVGADAGGYQFIANPQHPECSNVNNRMCPYRTVTLSEVLANKVPAGMMRDRIVVIGSIAPSVKDFFYTSYSGGLMTKKAQPTPGVQLQANFISQILSAASGRPLIRVWSEPVEMLWIFAWAWLGAALSWRMRTQRRFARRSPLYSVAGILLAAVGLATGSYVALIGGWWLPLVPPLLTLSGSAIAITSHIAHLQEELKRSKEFLQQVINTIPDPIFVKNKEHRWIVLNKAYCEFIGYPLEALIDKKAEEFFLKNEAEIFRQQDQRVFASGIATEHEEEFTDAAGKTHLIATKRSLHKDAAGNIFLVGAIRDITERKRIEEYLKRTAAELLSSNTKLKLSEDRLRYLAHHDTLTGLPNRQLFYEHLHQSLMWAGSNNLLVALLFVDLDGFKQVNDSLGHHIGDRLLIAVAQRLKSCLRASDIVSRLAGDEFTVILPAIPKVQVAATVAEKILTTLSEAFVLEGHTTFITASIGISVYPLNTNAQETLIEQADTAMYRAKQHGKNRYELV